MSHETELPNSPEAESTFLGSIFLDNRLMDEAANESPDLFYGYTNRLVFTAMLEIHRQHGEINHVTVANALGKDAQKVGGVPGISKLSDGLPAVAKLSGYTKILRQKHTARQGYKEAVRLQQAFLDEDDDPQVILASATERFSSMREASTNGFAGGALADIRRQVEDHLYVIKAGLNPSISTGLERLDQLTAGGIKRGEMWGIGALSSRGKALGLDTPLPTPTGWTTMKDVQVGDRLFDETGKVCNVIGVSPVMRNRPCYLVVFSDGTEVVADAEHKWFTETIQARVSAYGAKKSGRDERPPHSKFGRDQSHLRTYPGVVTTEEISKTLNAYGRKSHRIPLAEALELPFQKIWISPYVLGAWLGDGTSANARIACDDPEIIEHIEQCGYPTRKHKTKFMYGIFGGLQTQLRYYNLLKNKHIPAAYLRASKEQRLALLQGLMDTDGSCSKTESRCEITLTKFRLASQVRELVATLGFKPRMNIGEAWLNGKYCGLKYRIQFGCDQPVFRLKRKLDRIGTWHDRAKKRTIIKCEPIPSVPVKCLAVDSGSHLFLATRSFIPTHNTALLVQTLLHIASRRDLSQEQPGVVLFSLEMTALLIGLRILAGQAGIGVHKIKTGMSESDLNVLLEKARESFDVPVWIYTDCRSVTDIHSRIKMLKRKHPIQAVGIDYYGKLHGHGRGRDRYENRTQELKYIADYLQQEIAIQEEVGLIVPAQFNRSAWNAGERGPGNIDGGEAYFQACDLFAVLDTDSKKAKPGDPSIPASLAIHKQRNGPTATGKEAIQLDFHRDQMKFYSRLSDVGEEVPDDKENQFL